METETFKFEPLSKNNLKYDLPAGLAVFFVAVPLCLGVAHASGAPLIAGLITGVIGGIVAGILSNSHLSVSGPAAGLTAITLAGVAKLGTFEAFLLATVIAGLIQITLGILKTGGIANFVPTSVIKGMLSAIGLILIIKQFPHMIGYDVEAMGVQEFVLTPEDMNKGVSQRETNAFSLLLHSFSNLNKGVLFVGLISLVFLIIWDKKFQPKYKTLPGALIVVVLSVAINYIGAFITGDFLVKEDHLVNVPAISNLNEFMRISRSPDWSVLGNYQVYVTAFTIAIVASIETLLSVEAIDKLDPYKRKSPANRELIAQGVGNSLSGLLGGIPMTAVIVRGSVNISAGARTKQATIFHGLLIVISVIFLASVMNMIPLASLAAILIYTGYKLFKPSQLVEKFKKGWSQFIPFVITVTAIIVTDLLIGVIIGIGVSVLFIVIEDFRGTVLRVVNLGERKRIVLGESVTFFHRPKLVTLLDNIQEGETVEIDGSKNVYLDSDIREVIMDFKDKAEQKNIKLIIGGIDNMNLSKEEVKKDMQRSYDKLFENNKNWIAEKLKLDPDYFTKMSQGQAPQYLFIGCSDSRVPANEITGTQPGEMFVHRNIANMVVNTDMNLMSVLQYAVDVLNVKHVIVCGHYGCGGVKAAMENVSHGLIDKWLRNIKDVYRLYKDEVDAIQDPDLRHKRMVELNVREQVYNLMKTFFIQRNRSMYNFPEVHGWIYDINDGRLIDLKIDIPKDFPEFKDIYEIC